LAVVTSWVPSGCRSGVGAGKDEWQAPGSASGRSTFAVVVGEPGAA
jgi:hypothetical protein